jgi:hypothetical protein
VLSKVHDWVWNNGSNARRDTAAYAYASGLRQIDVRWNLADLQRTARDGMQQRKWTVAEAVRLLLEPDLADLVVATLAGWIRQDIPGQRTTPDRRVTVHAARALVRLVGEPAGDRWDSPPLLLLGLVEGGVPASDLALLWCAAWHAGSTKGQAWQALLDWLRHADRTPDLRAPAGELLHHMAKLPNLRRRMRYCLSRPDAPEWITTLIEEWDG